MMSLKWIRNQKHWMRIVIVLSLCSMSLSKDRKIKLSDKDAVAIANRFVGQAFGQERPLQHYGIIERTRYFPFQNCHDVRVVDLRIGNYFPEILIDDNTGMVVSYYFHKWYTYRSIKMKVRKRTEPLIGEEEARSIAMRTFKAAGIPIGEMREEKVILEKHIQLRVFVCWRLIEFYRR